MANPKPTPVLRSFFSISLFVILVIAVGFLTWNFVMALADKFA